ncbi:MAG: peptidylprolyl isomerase [Ignavibacteriales bacterium]|nr:peptidylprolyl isomerase [Ignavibacteriales bacterium]
MHRTKLLLLILPLFIFISCSSQNQGIVVAEYGNYKIYLDDFEKAYERNSGGFEKAKTDSLSSYQKFLDLYLNYKLKLRDAEVRGYTKDSDMQKELRDYKINIGSTLYLSDKLYEPNMHKLYEKRKTEYRASHIFLTPDSTMNVDKVKELGNELIKRIQNGEDFATLAKQYSKDTYSKNNGGDVYYFTAGLVNNIAIEDAVYGTELGKIYPELVFSGSGFHIIKITEKHPRRPSLTLEHILITFADSTGKADTANAFKTIQDIEQKIKGGADFGEMARKYSQDKGSAVQRGSIGSISRRRTVKEFEEAAFKLKKGEISPIVKTQYGYHLIRLADESPYPTYDQEKEELKEIYDRMRYKTDYEQLTEKLKVELKYSINRETFAKIMANSDTTKIAESYWKSKLQKVVGSQELFKINNKSYPCDSLFAYMIKHGISLNMVINSSVLEESLKIYSRDVSIKEKALIYDNENPEFAKLIDEYEKGIYLFQILEEEVWSKISVDSAKAYSFWEQNKQNYKWKNRVEFKEIFCQSDSLMNKCYSLVTSSTNYDTLFAKYNQRTGYDNTPGYHGLVDIDSNELSKQSNELKNIGDISKPFHFEKGWSIVKLIKRDSARLKTFDEAKAEASSQLQESESKRLEDEYLNKLKNIYKPKLYYEELSKAFKK